MNKQKKIVIYATIRNIQPREEITYDYKFPLAKDEVLGIACICSSKQCKRKNVSKCIIPILHLVLSTIQIKTTSINLIIYFSMLFAIYKYRIVYGV